MRRTYHDYRQEGINKLAKVTEHIYGPRCNVTEPSCATCHAWMMIDHMQRLLDSELLSDTVPERED